MPDRPDDRATTDTDCVSADESMVRFEPLRLSTTGEPPRRDPCDVVVEELLTIMVEDVGSFAVMCTPCDATALAIGFAFTEGIISSKDDIIQLSERRDPHVVAMRVDEPQKIVTRRNLIVTSACGFCGLRNLEQLVAGLAPSKDSLRISASLLHDVAAQMRDRQVLFAKTGGTHAAAIFSASGEIVAFAEDIGRHNALDKVIGQCVLKGEPMQRCGVLLSSRLSLELIAKAARAGIEIMGAVSAPSSLAIETADRCRITLCGFVRGDRATVYTHPQRIQDLDKFGS